MTPAEALRIIGFVRAACPAQRFDEYTPDVWAKLLEDVDYGDAIAACTDLGKRLTFIGPPEIRAEVRRIRAKRLEVNFEDIPELDAVADDPIAYKRLLRTYRHRVASGWTPPALERGHGRKSEEVNRLIRQTLAALPKVPATLPQDNPRRAAS